MKILDLLRMFLEFTIFFKKNSEHALMQQRNRPVARGLWWIILVPTYIDKYLSTYWRAAVAI